jgi:hypothetical protein
VVDAPTDALVAQPVWELHVNPPVRPVVNIAMAQHA